MASRFEALPDLSFLDFVQQRLPAWMLTLEQLNAGQRELLAQGIAFSDHFLDTPVRLRLAQEAARSESTFRLAA